MKTINRHLSAASVVLFAAFAFGQNADPQAVPTGPVAADTNTQPRYEENVRPLSGVQDYDLGYRADRFNLLKPEFTLSEGYGTNPGLTFGSNTDPVWTSTTTVGGALELARGNARRLFDLSYRGSGQFVSYDSDLNTQIHTLEVTQSINAGRWDLVIGDSFIYQPNAFGAAAPLLYAGSGVEGTSGFRPDVTPSDSILSSQSSRVNNTAVGQVSYGLSRRSILTANASYGILRYLDGDFLDSKQFTAGGGFDHRFGRNTVGLSYDYMKLMFDGLAPDFYTNTVQLTFARRVVGRFTFALGAGPSFTTFTAGPVQETKVDMSARATFEYAGNRSRMSIGYVRSATGGSGFTPGAITDSFSGSGERNLTRNISWNVAGGYARNTARLSNEEFNTVYVATGISRLIGRYVSVSIGYRGQRQTSNSSVQDLTSNSIVGSLVWRFRPVRLR